MKGGVFGKVNTLMEVRNMEIKEDFLAVALVMEQKLDRFKVLYKKPFTNAAHAMSGRSQALSNAEW
mgnify:CR=1 FL=1